MLKTAHYSTDPPLDRVAQATCAGDRPAARRQAAAGTKGCRKEKAALPGRTGTLYPRDLGDRADSGDNIAHDRVVSKGVERSWAALVQALTVASNRRVREPDGPGINFDASVVIRYQTGLYVDA